MWSMALFVFSYLTRQGQCTILDNNCQDNKEQLRMAKNLGIKIRELRTNKGLQLRKAAAALDIDQSLLSKYERGGRLPNEDFVKRVAKLFSYDEKELMALLMSDKFLAGVTDVAIAGKALKIAEKQIKYSVRKE